MDLIETARSANIYYTRYVLYDPKQNKTKQKMLRVYNYFFKILILLLYLSALFELSALPLLFGLRVENKVRAPSKECLQPSYPPPSLRSNGGILKVLVPGTSIIILAQKNGSIITHEAASPRFTLHSQVPSREQHSTAQQQQV